MVAVHPISVFSMAHAPSYTEASCRLAHFTARLMQAASRVRGAVGTKIRVVVTRDGEAEALVKVIERATVKLDGVTSYLQVRDPHGITQTPRPPASTQLPALPDPDQPHLRQHRTQPFVQTRTSPHPHRS